MNRSLAQVINACVLLQSCLLCSRMIAQESATTDRRVGSQYNSPGSEPNATSPNKTGKVSAEAMKLTGRVTDVSGLPVEGAKVHFLSSFAEIDATVGVGKDGAFEISLRMEPRAVTGLQISAVSADGSRLGYHRIPQTEGPSQTRGIDIPLKPVATARVKVIGPDDKPIMGARVAFILSYPITVGPLETDVEGFVGIRLPENETVTSAVSWKDGMGLDYRLYTLPREQAGDRLTQLPKFPFESHETLKLDGAVPLAVRISDMEGVPIQGAKAHVWLLRKESENDSVNLSFLATSLGEISNEKGIVTFDWFPKWQNTPTVVWPRTEGYVDERGVIDPAINRSIVEIKLHREIPMRGQVTFPDGSPAPNIAVTATGMGYSSDGFHETTKTDDSGKFQFDAAPNQIYMIYITDSKWSAPSQSGFAAFPGKQIPDHHFLLRPATRIFGRVINKVTGTPVEGRYVMLSQKGIALNEMDGIELPNPEKSNRWVCPMRQYGVKTTADGSYEFFVGGGDYTLFTQGFDGQKFSVADEKEKRVDLPIQIETKRRFSGLVVDGKTKEPIGEAQLVGISREFAKNNNWKATSTADGKFLIDRFPEPTVVHAVDNAGKRGEIAKIEANQMGVVLELHQIGSASGRLLTEDGTQPAAGIKLSYGVRLYDEEEQVSTSRFGKVITTDEHGDFTMTNLVPGWEYECILHDHPGGYLVKVTSVTIEEGEVKTLGAIKTPPIPKPYTPPTLEELTASAFNASGTSLERLQNAKTLVADAKQNLLVVFGNPTDSRTIALMKVRYEDPRFHPYRDDFRFLAISTAKDRFEDARALVSEMSLSSKLAVDGLLLAVVHSDGKVVVELPTSELSDGDQGVVVERFLKALEPHRTIPLDAKALLEEALSQAAKEDKQVIVQETATWCGPCHSLSRLLQQNRQWEKDYVWVKMDHRWIGAVEIMQKLRGGAEGGIPWFAILDSEGETLVTSNIPDSGDNIGFPSEPKAIEHFANMFKLTRQRMTDQEIADLILAVTRGK